MKSFVLISFLLIGIFCNANDGSFRVEGNQLIPMYETDISVKKEILSIRRINSSQVEITVYYEFFNPKESKNIEVGFEAVSPSGDVDNQPANGKQPYIHQFTVIFNGEALAYKVAIVKDSLYFRNGKYKSITIAQAKKESEETEDVDFFYVYHFLGKFRNGINIIQHTYVVDLSNSVVENYSLTYILTGATRWSNRQIDDFTLKIDVGDFQDFCIKNTFFNDAKEWAILGTGTYQEWPSNSYHEIEHPVTEFFIRKGSIEFQKKNFKPKGEIYILSSNSYDYSVDMNNKGIYFLSTRDKLPFSIDVQDQIQKPADELSKSILRNLPFARRGFIFKSQELQIYYKRQKWYVPDPDYKTQVNQLTKKEQIWLMKLKN